MKDTNLIPFQHARKRPWNIRPGDSCNVVAMPWQTVDSAAKCNRGIEADCKVFSKSIEEGLRGRFEAEAFSGREVQCHGDVLNVFVTEVVEIG